MRSALSRTLRRLRRSFRSGLIPTAAPLLSALVLCGCGPRSATKTQPAPSPPLIFPPEPSAEASAPTPVAAPRRCVPPEPGMLQDITASAAAPYVIHHPTRPSPTTETVIFLPGGAGTRAIAINYIWKNWLARGHRVDEMRVVVPYASKDNFAREVERVLAIRDEVLACYGGAPARVHLAGTSNGGRQSFRLMLESGQGFASLLGAPGVFPSDASDEVLRGALAGKPVYSGVGALDDDWRPGVFAAHQRLGRLGLSSRYVEFPEQGHILDERFDPSGFYEFWLGPRH